MLWREGYDTVRLGDLPPVPIDGAEAGTAVIVAAGVSALAEFGVWVRLVESDFGPEAWRGVLVGPRAAFEEMLPPSRLARCAVVDSVALPVVAGRVLSFVWTPSGVRSAMVGPATEEAWDEFSDAMRAARAAPADTAAD